MAIDIETLAATIGIAKKLPDTAVGKAEAAANRAESAAEEAETHNMGVSVSGTTLMFSSNS